MFTEADEEFLPIAKELYEQHKEDLHLTVDPELVMFLRSDCRKKAFAYAKKVTDEYELLTDKKFFIVFVNKYFNRLKSEKEKRFVLLHEMKHLNVDDDKYRLLDHNLKEFTELLRNPSWNLDLIEDDKNAEENTKNTDEIKIGLDFDFHNLDEVRKLKEKIKEEEKAKEKNKE